MYAFFAIILINQRFILFCQYRRLPFKEQKTNHTHVIFLANPKLGKTGIDMTVRFRKVRYKRSTGVSAVTKFWNAERQLSSVTKQYRDGVSVNYKLTEWKNAIDRLPVNLEERQITIIDPNHFWQLAACRRLRLRAFGRYRTAFRFAVPVRVQPVPGWGRPGI